jgi:phosphoglycolate phosphatase-like HAD superfamily hydrolase
VITSLIFDFDGVIGLSRELAWEAGRDILRVFGRDTAITSMREHRRVFGREAQEGIVGPDKAEVLREMHRLAMREKATRIPVYGNLLNLLPDLKCPVGIITAGYAQTASRCLGDQVCSFSFVRGREDGGKTRLLGACRVGDFSSPLYVCDTVRDIRRCHDVGLPVCATAWDHAYDEFDDLAAEQPDWVVRDLHELINLLRKIHLLS